MFVQLILSPVLRCATTVYRYGLNLHQSMYTKGILKTRRVKAHVISVGNLTWGGSGKTPMVIMVAKHLTAMGKKVAVLTRGFGDDEYHELKDRLKGVLVLKGRNRFNNAQKAIREFGADCIVMDDGFQHWPMARDLDIVAINATNPFGNELLIPAGSLREPVENVKRAQCIVLTQAFLGRQNIAMIRRRLKDAGSNAHIFEADHRPKCFVDYRRGRKLPLEMVRNHRIAVMSGIEDPTSLENCVSRLGANIVYAARFGDHHAFSRADVKAVFKSCRECKVKFLITTAKDAQRLKRVLSKDERSPTRIIVLKIELRMNDEESFVEKCLAPPALLNVA